MYLLNFFNYLKTFNYIYKIIIDFFYNYFIIIKAKSIRKKVGR